MTGEGSHDFARARRILKTDEFSSVFRLRPAQKSAHFVLYTRPSPLPHARLGIVAAKRFAPRAVTRNTIKRITRELFRTNEIQSVDCIVRLARPVNTKDGPGDERRAQAPAACRTVAPVSFAASTPPCARCRRRHENPAHLDRACLSARAVADARAELPLLSVLFQLRHRSAAHPWCLARWLAGRAPPRPLPSLERGRRRSGSAGTAQAFTHSRLRLQPLLINT